ncbi:bestrophin-like domain [Pseudomonas sp. CLCA07]
MSPFVIALIAFACVFGSALLGLYIQKLLPEHHLSDESIAVVKLATGLIATMAALVLGLLISSAKVTFETTSTELTVNAAKVFQFDRVLARYGPETQDIRAVLKRNYATVIELVASHDSATISQLDSPEAISRSDALRQQIDDLKPGNDSQRALKARAQQIADEVLAARWLTLLQAHGSIPVTLLIILVAWLSVIFGAFGVFAPNNGTVIAAFLTCALSASAAILLIQEMNRPLDGLIGVSVEPMRDTLSRLGQ